MHVALYTCSVLVDVTKRITEIQVAPTQIPVKQLTFPKASPRPFASLGGKDCGYALNLEGCNAYGKQHACSNEYQENTTYVAVPTWTMLE